MVELGSDTHGPANSLADLRWGLDQADLLRARTVWGSGGRNAAAGDVVMGMSLRRSGPTARLPLAQRLLRQIRVTRALHRAVRQSRPQVVHANTSSAAVVVALVARLSRVPQMSVHVREESLHPHRRRTMTVALLIMPSTIIVPSDLVLPSIPAWWSRWGIAREVLVVPNAVRPPERRRGNGAPARCRVVTVLSSSHRKAADVFADVVVATADRRELEWHVYGPRRLPAADSWLGQQLHRAESAVGARLVLHPRVDRLVDHLVDYDLAFLPSRDESFGRVAVEATAAGVVPIWARNYGFTSSLSPELDETSFAVDDVDGAASLIRALSMDSGQRGRWTNVLADVARRYHPETIAKQFADYWTHGTRPQDPPTPRT